MMRLTLTALLTFGGAGVAHAQDATGCPARAEAYKIEDTPAATIIHCRCTSGYHAENGECVAPPPPSKSRLSCLVAQARIDADLRQIETQRQLAAENQLQFAEWDKMSDDGHKDLLKAGVELAVGSYAAQEVTAGKDIDALEKQANALAKSAYSVNKLKQIKAELEASGIPFNSFVAKLTAKAGLDAKDSWELAKGSMHDGFRAAAGTDAKLASELNDPEFREALLGPPEETTAYEHTANTVNAAVGQLAGMKDFLGDYVAITAPTVRITSFVIDAGYADLEIWFAANGRAQADQTAGQLARAADLIVPKYWHDMDAKENCVP